ncbi:MAG: DUF1177 domain-containing protein [Nitrososphaeria archaeon]|nr:DUF1177 domain-containing protein [Nitrososphaeria archaeon]MDW7986234.1 DUF1177 domain-containing protein [Nitrososphaerota archaeon]
MSTLKHVLHIIDLLDDPYVDGEKVRKFFLEQGFKDILIEVETIRGDKSSTDFLSITIPGVNGKISNGKSPTLGIVGRLGGVGARPSEIGLVSDADGAIVALAAAYKIGEMKNKGEPILGDTKITTHICPNAPTRPHKPAPMMDSPIDIFTLLKKEVSVDMDAVLSVDATKANLVIKHTGFAITPTVKEGWILKVSEDLIDIYIRVTGEPPVIVPITMQDILPYSTPVYHLNSMMQPWIFTEAPVVGVATTTKMIVPGSATGVTNINSLEQATRFVVEVAKKFGRGEVRFYEEEEWRKILTIHGSIKEIMKKGAPI